MGTAIFHHSSGRNSRQKTILSLCAFVKAAGKPVAAFWEELPKLSEQLILEIRFRTRNLSVV